MFLLGGNSRHARSTRGFGDVNSPFFGVGVMEGGSQNGVGDREKE